MKFTWLGHSGFRIEIADQVLLVDPWLEGNPAFPEARRAEAITGATAILISHGHFDHIGGVPAIARELDIPIVGTFDLPALVDPGQHAARGRIELVATGRQRPQERPLDRSEVAGAEHVAQHQRRPCALRRGDRVQVDQPLAGQRRDRGVLGGLRGEDQPHQK
ncbi:hypothetical protein CNY89_00015 [Amaricoccus sp. HAR-UPW-R2A-40]|nr:hypothetical protein CNY89_00015 [Amaricoccus sp. HAR-UPW-R2A-40]